jgi:putative ABC transport system permease protein
VNAHFQQLYRTPLAFAFVTPGILLFATGISLLLGVGAGAVAGWRLVRSAPLALLGR